MTTREPHVEPEHVREAMDNTVSNDSDTYDIYMHKDAFKDLGKLAPGTTKVYEGEAPIIEGHLGSTKQIGSFDNAPVYSHGKAPDHVYVAGGDDEENWWKGGEIVDAPR
jgi:hypothetical protein